MSSGSAAGGSWPDIKQAPPQRQKQQQGGLLDQDDHDRNSARWDPVMTSLLKASESSGTARPSSYSNSYLQQHSGSGSSPLQLGGFSDLDSNLQATCTAIHQSAQSATQPVLNAPSSAGASATKVSKKRSRASRRPPTTVLEADSANFRSMVQHLTGIPAPPPMLAAPPSLHHSRFDFLGVGMGIGSGLVRPQPTRHFTAVSSSFGSGGFTISMPTTTGTTQLLLDSSSSSSSRGGGLFGHPAAHFTQQQQQQQLTTSLNKLDDLRSSFSYTRAGAPYPGHDNLDSTSNTTSSRNLFNNNSANSDSTRLAMGPGSGSSSGVSNAAPAGSASALSTVMPLVPTMPSLALWDGGGGGGGGECLSVSRSRFIKREVEVGVAEEASGRPMASWSTGL